MNKVSLQTKAGIRALLAELGKLPEGYDKVHFDSTLPGYGLRVRGSGTHSLMVQYAIARRSRRVVLGPLDRLEPGKAYGIAKDLLAKVRLGGDPATDKARARAQAAETFGALLSRFLERQQAKQKPRSYEETERHLLKHCRAFHTRPVENLDRRAIGARLAEIAKKSGPAAANRTRASLSAYFTWLAKEGFVDANPVAFTNRQVEKGERDRVLDDGELRTMWQALDDEPYSVILKLLLLTGVRRDEIGGLRWSEVDLDIGLIKLPPARTKSRQEFLVPLSEPALQLLEAQPRRTSPDGTPRDHIFGTGLERGFQGWSKSKAELDARIAGKVSDWTLHDFRRSLSTTLHDVFDVAPHLVEAILGHVSGHQAGVAGRYNKALYLDQRRRAMKRWGAHVMSVVTGEPVKGKVVDLRGRRT